MRRRGRFWRERGGGFVVFPPGHRVPFGVAALLRLLALLFDEVALVLLEGDEALPAVFLEGVSHRRPAATPRQ